MKLNNEYNTRIKHYCIPILSLPWCNPVVSHTIPYPNDVADTAQSLLSGTNTACDI